MKKIHTKALILLAALTSATTSSCDDKFEVVETGARIEDVVEITVHDVEVDWDWNRNSSSVTVGEVFISDIFQFEFYVIKEESPDWLEVRCDRYLQVACTDGGNYSENPREGVVTITVANAPDEFVKIKSGGKVEIPYQEMKKSFTVRQAGRPASDPDIW